MGGGPSLQAPSCHFRVDSRWSACAIGKQGPPLVNAIFTEIGQEVSEIARYKVGTVLWVMYE